MVTFQVPDITCGHCASSIVRAVAGVDRTAVTEVDIPRKLVRITSGTPAAKLAQAIQEAGYTPQEVQAEPAPPAVPRAAPGCGCGCGPNKAPAVAMGQRAAAGVSSCCG